MRLLWKELSTESALLHNCADWYKALTTLHYLQVVPCNISRISLAYRLTGQWMAISALLRCSRFASRESVALAGSALRRLVGGFKFRHGSPTDGCTDRYRWAISRCSCIHLVADMIGA